MSKKGKFITGDRDAGWLLRNVSEDQIQTMCIKIFDAKYPDFSHLFFHVPNGGKRLGREASKMKRMGVRSGVADLMFMVPIKTHSGLVIEMKAHGGKTSKEQQRFLRDMEAAGHYCIVIDSVDLFERTVDQYMAEVFKERPNFLV